MAVHPCLNRDGSLKQSRMWVLIPQILGGQAGDPPGCHADPLPNSVPGMVHGHHGGPACHRLQGRHAKPLPDGWRYKDPGALHEPDDRCGIRDKAREGDMVQNSLSGCQVLKGHPLGAVADDQDSQGWEFGDEAGDRVDEQVIFPCELEYYSQTGISAEGIPVVENEMVASNKESPDYILYPALCASE